MCYLLKNISLCVCVVVVVVVVVAYVKYSNIVNSYLIVHLICPRFCIFFYR